MSEHRLTVSEGIPVEDVPGPNTTVYFTPLDTWGPTLVYNEGRWRRVNSERERRWAALCNNTTDTPWRVMVVGPLPEQPEAGETITLRLWYGDEEPICCSLSMGLANRHWMSLEPQ